MCHYLSNTIYVAHNVHVHVHSYTYMHAAIVGRVMLCGVGSMFLVDYSLVQLFVSIVQDTINFQNICRSVRELQITAH